MKRGAPLKRTPFRRKEGPTAPREAKPRADAGPKARTCEMCPKQFIQRSSLHTCCSQRCAMRKVKRDNEAKAARERQQITERRQALETIPELIRAAQREFNAYIRARDEGKPCICCGRYQEVKTLSSRGGDWDCGHYRSTGSASHLRFDERNAHRQLKVCNRYGAGRAVDYRIGLIARIGMEAVEDLEADNEPRKWTREELREIRDTYRRKLSALKKERQEA
jgi:hypothetical protein